MIDDWFDVICVCGLDFLIIVIGVWVLPQLPEKTHFIVALSILLSSIFFTKKIVEFIVEWFKRCNINKISIKKILTSTLFIVFGIILIIGGLKFHSSVVDSYNCKTCSIFDEECVDGFYSDDNQRCLDALEWPFKFSLIFIPIGVGVLFIAIMILIDGYRNKEK